MTEDDGLVLRDGPSNSSRILVSDVTSEGLRAPSPSQKYLAFSFQTADSTHLALLNLVDHSLRPVDSRSRSATYTLSWHPERDRLAFGYYGATESGTRGPGEIFTVTPTGTPESVECSAAREVLQWLPSGSLATRDDENLYVVAPNDCATRSAAEAPHMNKVVYAPTETRLAYLHTELTYDEEAHEYTPDTSLYLSSDHGRRTESLFGSDRRPRHLRWSPDGSELAFTVQVDGSNWRQVSIYSVSSERTVYLTPPQHTTGHQTHPRWSPTGAHIAFTLSTARSSSAAIRIDGHTRRLAPVDEAVWGWLNDRALVVPGPDSLRVKGIDGSTRYAQPRPSTLLHVWRKDAL